MHTDGQIVVVVPSREQAEAVVADLARADIVRAEIVRPRPGTYELEDESLHERVKTGEHGLLLGLGVGALVGLAVVLVVSAMFDLSLEAQLLLLGGIAVQGTLPAIMWRMGRADRFDDDPRQTRVLGDEDWLVVLDETHRAHHARYVLERHGAVFLADAHPLEIVA